MVCPRERFVYTWEECAFCCCWVECLIDKVLCVYVKSDTCPLWREFPFSDCIGWCLGHVHNNSGMLVVYQGLYAFSPVVVFQLPTSVGLLVLHPALGFHWLLADFFIIIIIFFSALGYKFLHSVSQLNLGPLQGLFLKWVFEVLCDHRGAVLNYFFPWFSLVNSLPYDLVYCSHEAITLLLIAIKLLFWEYP